MDTMRMGAQEYEQQLTRARQILGTIPQEDLTFLLDMAQIKPASDPKTQIEQVLVALRIDRGVATSRESR